jgi:UDP-N-acetylglucosamine acyltransferase
VKVYGLNKVGLRRRGLSRQELDALNDAYRIYQDPQLNFSQALEKLQALPQKTAQVAALLGFLTSSQRGVYR